MMNRAYTLGLLCICAITLFGCPAPSPTVGDDTGGPLPADPIDPFEGEGSDPPGEPDQSAGWTPPTSLGNGLVYDTRFDIAEHSNVYSVDVTGMDLAAGIDWSSFVTPYTTKISGGFRPTAIDADVDLGAAPDRRITLELVDRSAYASDDDANYRHETRTYIFTDTTAEQYLAMSGSAAPESRGRSRSTHSPSQPLVASRSGLEHDRRCCERCLARRLLPGAG